MTGLATKNKLRCEPTTRVAVRPSRTTSTRVVAYIEEKKPKNAPKQETFLNQLHALKSMSVVVADTGEFGLVKKYKPMDCTTNPSLVLKAVQNPEYEHLVKEAVLDAKKAPKSKLAGNLVSNTADILAVNIGHELLKIVPGRVSTEVDARMSYSIHESVDKALRLVDLYAKKGVDPSRLYIKLASTWEGIKACEALEKQGINCNMTLLFSFGQAAACADVGASLISPFVGRILDWYKAKEKHDFLPPQDPGVLSVKRIYKYYKANDYKTIVMAASFRNIGEIRQLAGCDKITIAPNLLAELEASPEPLPRMLWPEMGGCNDELMVDISEEQFTDMHGSDPMAVDKLVQGIDAFAADQVKLEQMIAKAIAELDGKAK